MATPVLNTSLRRSSRISTPSSTPSTIEPPSTVSNLERPDLSVPRNPFSSLYSDELAARMNSEALQNDVAFTRERFQILCDKQRTGREVEALKSPSRIVEMSWSPRGEKNMELADEVNEWIQFLPYGDGSKVNTEGGNASLGLCKWIMTTRSQNESGQWVYVDRSPTREEILRFKEKGWPYIR